MGLGMFQDYFNSPPDPSLSGGDPWAALQAPGAPGLPPGNAAPAMQLPPAPPQRQGFFDRMAGGLSDGGMEVTGSDKRAALSSALLSLGANMIANAPSGNWSSVGGAVQDAMGTYKGDLAKADERVRMKRKDDLDRRLAETQMDSTRANIDVARANVGAINTSTKNASDAGARETEDWDARKRSLDLLLHDAHSQGLGLSEKDVFNIRIAASGGPGSFDKALGTLQGAIASSKVPDERKADLEHQINQMRAGVIPDHNKQAALDSQRLGLESRRISSIENGDRGVVKLQTLRDDISAEEARLFAQYKAEEDAQVEHALPSVDKATGEVVWPTPNYDAARKRAREEATSYVSSFYGLSMPEHVGKVSSPSTKVIEDNVREHLRIKPNDTATARQIMEKFGVAPEEIEGILGRVTKGAPSVAAPSATAPPPRGANRPAQAPAPRPAQAPRDWRQNPANLGMEYSKTLAEAKKLAGAADKVAAQLPSELRAHAGPKFERQFGAKPSKDDAAGMAEWERKRQAYYRDLVSKFKASHNDFDAILKQLKK